MGLPMMPRPIKPMMGLFIFSTSSLGYCNLRSYIHQRLADVWCAIDRLLQHDGFGLGIFFRQLIMANCKPCRGGADPFSSAATLLTSSRTCPYTPFRTRGSF